MPLFIIKKWDGTELIHQLGFPSSGGKQATARWIEKAVKENGPITPPKALKPLIKGLAKAKQQLEKDKPGPAYKELEKVVRLGADQRRFPEGPPRMAKEAQALLDGILADATKRIEDALALEEEAPDKALKALRALQSRFRQIPAAKKRLSNEIARLKQ